MPLGVEVIVDGSVDGSKALGLDLRLEELHLALSPPNTEMRMLDPVILS